MIKLTLCVIFIFFIFSVSINAQIVLEPMATGSAEYCHHSWRYGIFGQGTISTGTYDRYDTLTPHVEVNNNTAPHWFSTHCYNRWSSDLIHRVNQGVLEFNLDESLSGASFPPTTMTAYNWTAQLVSLNCTQQVGDLVSLYDLQDVVEDGVISRDDYDMSSTYIAEGMSFNEIDVTNALRHDLFDETQTGSTSGFMLKTSSGYKYYDYEMLRIIITTGLPTPIPTPPVTVTPTLTSTPIPTFTPTHTQTPIPTDTPSPSQTPSPTITPTATIECTELGCSFEIPQDDYQPGDEFYCNVILCNPHQNTLPNMLLWSVLDVFGEYYVLDPISFDGQPGIEIFNMIPSFIWPDQSGEGNAMMYAAITDVDVTAVTGKLDWVMFSWRD